MKKRFLLLFAGLLALTVLVAQVVITSLDREGELTWTNAVSNATYRVEWATSANGPWNRFDALTNLNFISATNDSVSVHVPVSVQVPMFYRVVWTDAPPYAGTYDYRGYDVDGSLVVTGRLYLTGMPGSGLVMGRKELYRVGNSTNPVGPQLGTGSVVGGFTDSSVRMTIILNPEVYDNNVTLRGRLIGNTYKGSWDWVPVLSPFVAGAFTAVKLDAPPPPPANPLGLWDYSGWGGGKTTMYGVIVTGQLSFATSANPVTGSWLFNKRLPSFTTTHLVGQGDITNAVLSTNELSIFLQTADGSLTLEGQMAGDFYGGIWQGTGSAGSGQGGFLARRTPNGARTNGLLNPKMQSGPKRSSSQR